jgi:hypothetical protein
MVTVFVAYVMDVLTNFKKVLAIIVILLAWNIYTGDLTGDDIGTFFGDIITGFSEAK